MLTVPSVVSFTTGAGVEDPEELLVTGGECAAAFLRCWKLPFAQLQLEVTGADGR